MSRASSLDSALGRTESRPGSRPEAESSRRWLAACALGLALMLGACTSSRPPPTPLEDYAQTLSARVVWQQAVGRVDFPLVPAVHDSLAFVAGGDGTVMAIDVDTGAIRWQAEAGGAIAAGVGSDGRHAAVVTRRNELVVFEAGRVLWRKRLPAAVVTPPLVAGERVFVLAVDRAVQAFDVLDGRPLWTLQRPGDALTLAQSSVLMPFQNTLLAAQGGRLAGIDPLRGTVRWEVVMAATRGTNEIERLADLVGPALRDDNRICARAFQATVACADAARGVLLWQRNVGGLNAIGGDAERLFGADASDRINAWRVGSGDIAWVSERLLHRRLSGAAVLDRSVVFGDFQGLLHFMSTEDGAPQQRLATDGSAIVGAPRVVGRTLLVTTRNGGLFGVRAD
jgi:outer membrane protein assembly factor BamB